MHVIHSPSLVGFYHYIETQPWAMLICIGVAFGVAWWAADKA